MLFVKLCSKTFRLRVETMREYIDLGPMQIFIFVMLLVQIYFYYVIHQISLHTLCNNAIDYSGSPTKKLMLVNTLLFVGNFLLLVPTQIYNGYHKITFGLNSEHIVPAMRTFIRTQRMYLRKYNLLFGMYCGYVLMYIIWISFICATNIFPQCFVNDNKHIYYKCVVLLLIINVSYGVINVGTLYFWCQIVRKLDHVIDSKKTYCWLADYYQTHDKFYKNIVSLIIIVLHILSIYTYISDKMYNSNVLIQTIFWVGCVCDVLNILIMLYKNSMYPTIEYVILTVICTLNNTCLMIMLLVHMDNYSTFGIVSLIFSNIYVIGCLLWVLYWVMLTTGVLLATSVKLCENMDKTKCVEELSTYFSKSTVVLEQNNESPNNVYQNINSSLVEILLPESSNSSTSV